MHELDNAIKAFAAGQLDYAGLLRVLGGTLRDDPGAVPATIERLNAALEAGELPAPVHADFLKRIEQFSKANASSAPRPKAPPPAASTDSAASAPSPKAPPPAAPADDGDADEEDADDRTVMRAPSPPPAEEEDRTRLSTGHRLGGGGDPSASGGAGQSRPMPGSTGQSGGTGGAGTGSSWGHPSQWTGAGRGDAPLAVDSVIKERFVLQAEIGKGGMGVVFKALDLRKQEALDRNPYVAVKVLNEEFKRHPESLKALQREARKAQDLAHPNIVNVFDFDRDGDDVYMTMEYLEGEPLDELIQKQAMSGLPKDEAFPIIRGMALALNYAHEKGIIHSDFKPANCFLNKDGVVKVFDFGIARAAKHSD
ncbi:MAG: serine/threonine-protein kinase, partial [Pseudomonadota bacterium]